jgi:hypothetical protein
MHAQGGRCAGVFQEGGRSSPIAREEAGPARRRASDAPNLWISVKSTPGTPYRATLNQMPVYSPGWSSPVPEQFADGPGPLCYRARLSRIPASDCSRASWSDRCRRAPGTGLRRRHAHPGRCPPVRRGSTRLENGSAHHGRWPIYRDCARPLK